GCTGRAACSSARRYWSVISRGSGEGLAAAACAAVFGVGEGEPGLVETVLVVQRGAGEELGRCGVDDDLDGRPELGLLVVGVDVAVEEHLVGEATAATGPHGDAERQVVGTFCGQQFLHLDGSVFSERDHEWF